MHSKHTHTTIESSPALVASQYRQWSSWMLDSNQWICPPCFSPAKTSFVSCQWFSLKFSSQTRFFLKRVVQSSVKSIQTEYFSDAWSYSCRVRISSWCSLYFNPSDLTITPSDCKTALYCCQLSFHCFFDTTPPFPVLLRAHPENDSAQSPVSSTGIHAETLRENFLLSPPINTLHFFFAQYCHHLLISEIVWIWQQECILVATSGVF